MERLAALHAGLKLSLHEQLESALADSWQLGAPTRDALRVVETLCRKFPAFVRILLKRHGQRTAIEIVDEYDVQYLIHALLVLHFDYVVAEEHTPSRGGNPARMDFLLKNERIVVETKMTRKNLGQREVFDELVVDRERYKAHPDCETLVCFVFDPEHLCHNAEALERDLTSNEGHPRVRTFVAPK